MQNDFLYMALIALPAFTYGAWYVIEVKSSMKKRMPPDELPNTGILSCGTTPIDEQYEAEMVHARKHWRLAHG